jgi:hypothetical protein
MKAAALLNSLNAGTFVRMAAVIGLLLRIGLKTEKAVNHRIYSFLSFVECDFVVPPG